MYCHVRLNKAAGLAPFRPYWCLPALHDIATFTPEPLLYRGTGACGMEPAEGFA